MKLFCVLEQGCSVNDPLTLEHKRVFTTAFSDFYRLNWRTEHDPNAFITAKNTVWSEGRSYLYEKVPKDYKYYIFIDDDISFFRDPSGDVADGIRTLLDEYKPIAGTFFDAQRWSRNEWSFPREISREARIQRRAFPIAAHDLQVQICSKGFADVMFPVWYHGANKSMWYSQWACHNLFPAKQVCFTDVQVRNTRKGEHESEAKAHYSSGDKLVWLFNRHIRGGVPSIGGFDSQRRLNLEAFDTVVDRADVDFTFEDLAKIYNIRNNVFRRRKAIVDSGYVLRNHLSDLVWRAKNPGLIRGLVKRYLRRIRDLLAIKRCCPSSRASVDASLQAVED
jgi:hypothetical protein